MKVLSGNQIREADQFTINNEPIASIDLMERASLAFCEAFYNEFPNTIPIKVFCGKGNNGGDGLAISRILAERHYEVETFVLEHTEKGSPDFNENLKRLKNHKNVQLTRLKPDERLPEISNRHIVIDAIFGTGLTRPVEGFLKAVIEHIKNSRATIVSVDIPSGLYCDSINFDKTIIHASYTYTFQVPKFSFFIPESGRYTGRISILDIGLSSDFIEKTKPLAYFTRLEDIEELLPVRPPFSHKGTFGHTLIAGGSYGKIGAVVLSALGALRSGAGLVTVSIPKCGYTIMQTSVPEAMVVTGGNSDFLDVTPEMEGWDAIGVGPGLGVNNFTKSYLKELISQAQSPLILDADAINLLAANREIFEKLPSLSIITPHPGEFDRLAEATNNGGERIEKAVSLAVEMKICIVLKGQFTAVISPEGEIYFNSTGNAGMATGGTGDVLTGIIASLRGQGLDALAASRVGVYLHGLAGDLAAENLSKQAMVSSDLIDFLPDAFLIVNEYL